MVEWQQLLLPEETYESLVVKKTREQRANLIIAGYLHKGWTIYVEKYPNHTKYSIDSPSGVPFSINPQLENDLETEFEFWERIDQLEWIVASTLLDAMHSSTHYLKFTDEIFEEMIND